MTDLPDPNAEGSPLQLPPAGSIIWQDLTVPDAASVRDFYCQVAGWNYTDHDMGGYADYNMAASGQTVAGICHARGVNANVPPQWLVYIVVSDVPAAARRCQELGGQVLDGPRSMDGQRFCVIQDPAGAVAALVGP